MNNDDIREKLAELAEQKYPDIACEAESDAFMAGVYATLALLEAEKQQENVRGIWKVTSTEQDGTYPVSTPHSTEKSAQELVDWGNSFSSRIYSYEKL